MARFNQETRLDRCVRVSMQSLAVAIPSLLLTHGTAHAATPRASACEPTRVATLDQRLVAKADQNVGELRRFVQRTEPIFQMDMTTAVQRVEHQRQVDAACVSTVASR